MFFNWVSKDIKNTAEALYRQAVEQARDPAFYRAGGVPDTLDGRFDLIALHVCMIMHVLQDVPDKRTEKLIQALFDRMFLDMDRSLREMGVGDLGVPKRVKRMMMGFNGRLRAYDAALASKSKQDLRDTLCRNVYGTMDTVPEAALQTLAGYVYETIASLRESGKLSEGICAFPQPEFEERQYHEAA